jgi:hypothetical protein
VYYKNPEIGPYLFDYGQKGSKTKWSEHTELDDNASSVSAACAISRPDRDPSDPLPGAAVFATISFLTCRAATQDKGVDLTPYAKISEAVIRSMNMIDSGKKLLVKAGQFTHLGAFSGTFEAAS